MSRAALEEAISPTEDEARRAQEAARQLSRYVNDNLRIQVSARGRRHETVTLPAAAVRLLVGVLSEMAAGNAVTLTPIHAELTTQDAADVLNVSRPFLIELLEKGEIPFRKVGTHRRVLFTDLMKYRQKNRTKQDKAMKELAAQAQEMGMGY